MQMIYVEGGTFLIGSNLSNNKQSINKVTLDSFHIGKYQVTQKEWIEIMGSNPSNFKGDDLPVEQVSWEDVQKYIKKLNASGLRTFRLPSEAEWEFAAKGGNNSKKYKYSGGDDENIISWNRSNSGGKTHPVGQKMPNELDLYDMSGNVWEWCSDWADLYPAQEQTNPKGPEKGYYRVCRGGSWGSNDVSYLRVANRFFNFPTDSDDSLGFRLIEVLYQ